MAPMWKLKGRITEDGKLDVEMPPDAPAGEAVEVTLGLVSKDDDEPEINEAMIWTPEELAELDEILKIQPAKSGKEIVDFIRSIDPGSWADIEDPVEFILKQREDEPKRRGLEW